ncbi:hypothetical protein FGG08_005539 [Glutinoglossum americanum]|uniref:SET domain-containing protein n=1 Tax=Glutinoglossum americanum TaxID=1670608 RepID=A0A9P8I710_9PEZI|nr:hypothetical protein FGG08_005539 [Glutinoglossum americanum]
MTRNVTIAMKRQRLPLAALKAWSKLNNVEFHGVNVQHVGGYPVDKGAVVIASQDLEAGGDGDSPAEVLIRVPRELVLSSEMVHGWAKVDGYLKEVLDAVGDFGMVALAAKLNSLSREFNLLRESTEHFSWCEKIWWNDQTGRLSFQDWLDVDSWYRSRALHLPEVGNAMVPCIDMVNHRPLEDAAAYFDQTPDGDAVLLLQEGKVLSSGQEATINYGSKSASEMVFSYGFIDESTMSARELVLDIEIPDDDPLKKAKEAVSDSHPVVRLTLNGDSVEWQSSFIWLICVNEEDGIEFKLLQSVDGSTELQVFWKGEYMDAISSLENLLKADPSWEIFQLRAVSLLQDRVENQLMQLDQSQQGSQVKEHHTNAQTWVTTVRLRELEQQLMEAAILEFERQVFISFLGLAS